MNRYIAFTLVFTIILCAACGLTSEQKEVKDAYNELIDAFDAGNSNAAFDMMSSNTRLFLDDLALGLQEWDFPMGTDGRELLEEMFQDEDMTGLTRTVSSITVNGNYATLIAIAEDGDDVLEFIREDEEWMVDLESMLIEGIEEGLQGSGLTVEDILTGPGDYYDFDVEGDCPIDISNVLEDRTIYYVYVDLSSDPWGDDRLGAELLEPGEIFTVWVDAGEYDIKCEDEDGDTYTLWNQNIDEDGIFWEVTLADID